MEKDLKKILESTLFRECNQELALQIFQENGCRIAEYANNELMYSPKTSEHLMGLILDGKASVTTVDPSRKTLLRYLEKGFMFGIANLFSDEPYISVIRADGNCRVFLLPESAIKSFLEQDPSFMYRYISFLSGRVRFLNQKIGYLTAGSAERRLALYLASLNQESFHLDISISSLSDLLDVGRASLYRAFDKLREDGFLQKDGRTFVLLNKEKMLEAYR